MSGCAWCEFGILVLGCLLNAVGRSKDGGKLCKIVVRGLVDKGLGKFPHQRVISGQIACRQKCRECRLILRGQLQTFLEAPYTVTKFHPKIPERQKQGLAEGTGEFRNSLPKEHQHVQIGMGTEGLSAIPAYREHGKGSGGKIGRRLGGLGVEFRNPGLKVAVRESGKLPGKVGWDAARGQRGAQEFVSVVTQSGRGVERPVQSHEGASG